MSSPSTASDCRPPLSENGSERTSPPWIDGLTPSCPDFWLRVDEALNEATQIIQEAEKAVARGEGAAGILSPNFRARSAREAAACLLHNLGQPPQDRFGDYGLSSKPQLQVVIELPWLTHLELPTSPSPMAPEENIRDERCGGGVIDFQQKDCPPEIQFTPLNEWVNSLPPQWDRPEREKHICKITGGLKREPLLDKMRNLERLRSKFKEGLWGTEKGVTYKPFVKTGCIPTEEEVTSLMLEGCQLKGKIVCEDGHVINADMDYEIDEMLVSWWRVIFQTSFLFRRFSIHYKEHSRIEYGEDGRSLERDAMTPLKMKVEEPGLFRQLTSSIGLNFYPPPGEYERIKENTYWTEYDVLNICMCDVPDCNRMSSLLVKMCHAAEVQGRERSREKEIDSTFNFPPFGLIPLSWASTATEFLYSRAIYRRADKVNGNFDICYQCLKENALPVEK